MPKKITTAERIEKELQEFYSITNGAEKKKKLEHIRVTYGNRVAEKALKASPSFKY